MKCFIPSLFISQNVWVRVALSLESSLQLNSLLLAIAREAAIVQLYAIVGKPGARKASPASG